MASRFDPTSAKRHYELLEDSALIRIAYSSESGHIPEAIALAQEELSRRGISENTPTVVSNIEKNQSASSSSANTPLPPPMKAFCFILTPLPALAVALWQFASGRRRAAKEALTWMLYGLIFWALLKATTSSILTWLESA